MKSQKNPRPAKTGFDSDEAVRKATRLEPIRKSGKQRHSLYKELSDDDEFSELPFQRKESALDYLDE